MKCSESWSSQIPASHWRSDKSCRRCGRQHRHRPRAGDGIAGLCQGRNCTPSAPSHCCPLMHPCSGPWCCQEPEFLGLSSLLLEISLYSRWCLAYLCCRFCNVSCLRKINLFGSLLLAVYAGNILIKCWGKNKIRLLISENWTFSFYSYT